MNHIIKRLLPNWFVAISIHFKEWLVSWSRRLSIFASGIILALLLIRNRAFIHNIQNWHYTKWLPSLKNFVKSFNRHNIASKKHNAASKKHNAASKKHNVARQINVNFVKNSNNFAKQNNNYIKDKLGN